MKGYYNLAIVFLFIILIVAFLVAGTIIMTHKELKNKPILTKFMVSQLPWPKQRAAEFLIEKGHLKVAPSLIGRKIVSRLESEQRIKDDKQAIRNTEEETKELNRKTKFSKICKLLIKDFYNTRSVAKDRYMIADIKNTNYKYDYDFVEKRYGPVQTRSQLLEVTVTADYSFIPIKQSQDYNNDLPGKDMKDFLFKYDGESWLVTNMIDFS